MGLITALTSYNLFHNNCELIIFNSTIGVIFDILRVAFSVALTDALIDTFASIFAGMITFTGTGIVAHDVHTSVKELLHKSGKNFIKLARSQSYLYGKSCQLHVLFSRKLL